MHDEDLFLVVYQLATTIAGIPLVPKNIVHTTSSKMIRVTFPDNKFFLVNNNFLPPFIKFAPLVASYPPQATMKVSSAGTATCDL